MKLRAAGATKGVAQAPRIDSRAEQTKLGAIAAVAEQGADMAFSAQAREKAEQDKQYEIGVKLANKFNAKKLKESQDAALFDADNALVKYENDNQGKEFFDVDEIPEGIKVVRDEFAVNEFNGDIVSRPRQRIPAYEVWPQMYELRASQLKKAHGNRMGSNNLKFDYMAENQHQKHLMGAVVNQNNQIKAQSSSRYSQALLARNYKQAMVVANTSPVSDVAREALALKVKKTQETDTYNDSMSSDNIKVMKSSLAYLQQKQLATVAGQLTVNSRLPRGIRNNNPGNIEQNSIAWRGKLTDSTDERFAQFKTPADGIRAMSTLLDTYKNKYGLNTIADVIGRYSPVDDPTNVSGSTANYIADVADKVGVNENDQLSSIDRAALLSAMILRENGGMGWSAEEIAVALNGDDVAGGSPLAEETKPAADGYKGSLDQKERLTYVNALKTSISRLTAKKTGTNIASQNLLIRDINSAIDAVEGGELLNPRSVALLQKKAAAAAANHPNKMQIHNVKLNDAVSMMADISEFSQQPQVLRAHLLDSAEANKKGLTPAQFRKLETFRKADERVTKRINTDSMSFMIDSKLVDNVPMDFSTPESTEAFFATRKIAHEKTINMQGSSTGYLTLPEVEDFADKLDQGSTDEKLAMMLMIHNNMGSEAVNFWEQIKAEGAGSLALSGQIYSEGAKRTAKSIIRGKAFRKENPSVIQNYQIDFYPELVGHLSGAYSNQPKMLASTIDAVMDVYADKSSAAQDISGDMNTDRLEESVDEVTGGLIEVGGYTFTDAPRIEPPTRGMTQEALDTYIRDITPEWFEAKGGIRQFKGNYGELKDRMRDGDIQMVSAGKNHYALLNTDTNEFLSNAADPTSYFVFEYDKNATVKAHWSDARTLGTEFSGEEMKASTLLNKLGLITRGGNQ